MDTNTHSHRMTAWPGSLAGPGRGPLRFGIHLLEMQLAMTLGMAVGGRLGIDDVAGAEIRVGLWLTAMVVPMVAWMLVRGMSWRAAAEMTGAMAVPAALAIAGLWTGALGPGAAICLEHGAMTPAMVALMAYRRTSYGWDEPGHGRLGEAGLE